MKNKITIIAFILLLSACSSNGGDLPFSVPDDWEHVECPSSDQLDCDLEFPLPKGTEFELQGTPYTEAITSFRHYFPHSFNSAPYFTIQSLGSASFTFEEAKRCEHYKLPMGESCSIDVRYARDLPEYSIMAYTDEIPAYAANSLSSSESYYYYFLKTRDTIFSIIAVSEPDYVHLLDTSFLNARITKSVE